MTTLYLHCGVARYGAVRAATIYTVPEPRCTYFTLLDGNLRVACHLTELPIFITLCFEHAGATCEYLLIYATTLDGYLRSRVSRVSRSRVGNVGDVAATEYLTEDDGSVRCSVDGYRGGLIYGTHLFEVDVCAVSLLV